MAKIDLEQLQGLQNQRVEIALAEADLGAAQAVVASKRAQYTQMMVKALQDASAFGDELCLRCGHTRHPDVPKCECRDATAT